MLLGRKHNWLDTLHKQDPSMQSDAGKGEAFMSLTLHLRYLHAPPPVDEPWIPDDFYGGNHVRYYVFSGRSVWIDVRRDPFDKMVVSLVERSFMFCTWLLDGSVFSNSHQTAAH
jgi:hypothetical protein